ncbi:MgtC/SapB family protein [Craterilacuibacter sp.]|uniref:MgtC/SapB family protein n=1 Tax=Craterilacuibacter sp. TaxID=2870909 RepID=UPI003F345611
MVDLPINHWLRLSGTPFEVLPLFATSIAIGLFIGVERERKSDTIAGIRTFALATLLGTLLAMLAQHTQTPWLPAIGLLLIGSLSFLPSPPERLRDSRTTTQAALFISYGLGVLVWHGQVQLAIALGVLTTLLLYLKRELSSLSHELSRRDLLSIIQFCALTFIILPLLPDHSFGPYQAFNPYKVWLLVVLIVGVGLAGFLALKTLGPRFGAPILGIMGGVVSSTATTLVYAREARAHPDALPLASQIILLANLVLFVRLLLVTALVMPAALPAVAKLLLPALIFGLLAAGLILRKDHMLRPQHGLELQNPTQLRLALGFAVLFAVVLIVSAWLNELFGSKGLYFVALISGLNDVDAITLTLYQMLGKAQIDEHSLIVAMLLAIAANSAFKFGLITTLGGRALALRCLPTFAATLIGMGLGLALS